MNVNVLFGVIWFFIGHIIVWFQLNGQFKWEIFNKYQWLVVICGIPISYIYLLATKYTVQGFDGLLWLGRFIGFGVGMVIYSIFTSHFFDEGITVKTSISLGLCLILISVQLFCK
jgi:hypothetical protein